MISTLITFAAISMSLLLMYAISCDVRRAIPRIRRIIREFTR